MKDSLEIQATAIPSQNEISKLKHNLNKPKNKISNSLTTDDIVNFRSTNPNMKKIRTSTPEITHFRSKNLLSKSSSNFNKDIPDEASMRNKFQLCLGKLNDNSTKEIAFSQLKDIISTNSTEGSLRIYLSALSSFSQNCSIAAKEIHTLLYGYIASIYRENLMDPLDTPPNIIKTINRILTHIRNLYMKENSYVIHKACSHSVLEIYDQCMPKDNLNTILLMFIEPMTSMLFSGAGNYAQMGAAICLSDFIYHLGQDTSELNNKMLIVISGKIIPLAIKKSLDNQYLYEALYNLMQTIPFDNFTNYLKELYEQLGFVIKQPKYNYMTKINSLKVLGLIAQKLKSMTDIAIGYYQTEIIQAIEYAAKDRVHKVQLAAQDALKEWRELEVIYNEIEQKKMQIATQQNDEGQLIHQGGAGDEVGNSFLMKNKDNIKKMDKLNFLRNLAKIAKNENKKVEYDSELPEKMREEVYKKGIGNILKLSNFLKNKNQKGNNSNSNSKSPNKNQSNQLKTEINDYLKHSNQVKKYDSKAKMPFNECERISEVNEGRSEGGQGMMNLNPEIKFGEEKEGEGDQMIMPMQIQQSHIQYNNDDNNNNMPIVNDQVEQENISHKSKKRLPKIEEAKDYPRDQIISKPKNKKTYVNANPIDSINANLNSNGTTNKPIVDLTGIKRELSKLIITNLSNSYSSFEKQITSRLYDMNNKINDVYLKIQDYQKNNDTKANIYHINNNEEEFNNEKSVNSPLYHINEPNTTTNNNANKTNDKLNREEIYTEVMNNVKAEIESNKKREEETDSVITRKWKEALRLIEQGQIENAYVTILNSGDDIYLLRLICITGPVFEKISPEISKRVLMRVNMISRSHQIQSLLINLIRHSLNEKIFEYLNQNEQNDILDSLFEFSGINTTIGSEAAELYTRITK